MKSCDKTISIIVEWENVQLSKSERANRMLNELSRQINNLYLSSQYKADLKAPVLAFDSSEDVSSMNKKGKLSELTDNELVHQVEVIVMFNPKALSYDDVVLMVTRGLKSALDKISLCILEASGEHYYQMKNIGAFHSKGEILIFWDSDIIPNDHWIENILATFDEHPEVRFVGGVTYIDPTDLYSKAFALFWFFPLLDKNSRQEITITDHFYANNFACYREVLKKHPFPKDPKRFRTQCCSLVISLKEAGINVYRNKQCVVSHPAPNGYWHFVNRSFCQGSDRYWFKKFHNHKVSIGTTLKSYKQHIIKSINNPIKCRKEVNLKAFGVPIAIILGISYYTLFLLGELITFIHPGFVKKHFSI